jgi:hypothetical protein
VLTTASITLIGKTGISRYGKINGPIAKRRQPTNPAQSALRMSGCSGIVLLTPFGLLRLVLPVTSQRRCSSGLSFSSARPAELRGAFTRDASAPAKSGGTGGEAATAVTGQRSELGRQVAVDFETDTNLFKCRSSPDHPGTPKLIIGHVFRAWRIPVQASTQASPLARFGLSGLPHQPARQQTTPTALSESLKGRSTRRDRLRAHIFVTASIEVPDRNAYLVPISQ